MERRNGSDLLEAPPALEVRDLRVTYPGPPAVRAVDGVSLSVNRGECVGILGESGSGKSTLARTLLGLSDGARVEGVARLDGLDLLSLDEEGWRRARWRQISLCFQSTASLNPVIRVGQQLAEALQVHLGLGRGECEHRVDELLTDVSLGLWAASRYPSELSGGQKRLVLLAMALACDPRVAVLDEPTAGLDAATRDRVLDLLQRVREELGTTLIVMSHDVEGLEAIADRVAVLYRGWMAETGPAQQVIEDPRNPYSWALLNALSDARVGQGSPRHPR